MSYTIENQRPTFFQFLRISVKEPSSLFFHENRRIRKPEIDKLS